MLDSGASQVVLVVKNPPANAEVREVVLSPGSGKFLEEDLYSCLKNPMDRGAWQATVHTWHTGTGAWLKRI